MEDCDGKVDDELGDICRRCSGVVVINVSGFWEP